MRWETLRERGATNKENKSLTQEVNVINFDDLNVDSPPKEEGQDGDFYNFQ